MYRNETNLRFLQDAFWRERILGVRELEEDKIRKRMDVLNIKAYGPFYCVVIFAPYLMNKDAEKIDYLLNKLLEQIRGVYERLNIESYMISDEYCNVVGVFSFENESDYYKLNEITKTITKKMMDKHKLEMFVGIGQLVEQISLLGKSKDTATGALAYKFTFSQEHVITTKDVQRYYNDVSMELKRYYDRVLGCFYDGNLKLLSIRFHELCTEVTGNSAEGLNTIKNVCIELTATLLRVVREMGIRHAPELDGIYTHIAQIQSIVEIEEWFVAYCSSLLQGIDEFRQNKTLKLVEQAEEFIVLNIHNRDLDIRMISEYVGLTTAYFSELFYREKGIHINEYIGRRRVEEAKRLLWGTNDKIVQIAETVGFSSPNYFNNVFKRFVGMTPKQYRETKSL